MLEKPPVLIVDDRPENLVAVEAILQNLDITLHKALLADGALHFLLQNDAAVILLDVEMPGMDGFETARMIRQRQRSHDTPIIFMTAGNRGDAGIREGYELGAVDYLTKPLQPDVLRWKVSVFAELYRSRQRQHLFVREQLLRTEAEASARRARLLADIGRIIASDIQRGPLLNGIPQRLVPDFADAAALYLPQPGEMLQIDSFATKGQNALESTARISFTCAPKDPLFKTFQDGSPNLVNLTENRHAMLSALHQDFVRKNRFESGLFIPIRGRAGTIAVLALYRSSSPQFSPMDGAFAEELSDRIVLNVANIELFQESEKASRAKDEFLAIVSHELRTPLVAIVGWTNLLLSRDVPPETVNKALDAIRRNANLQTTLVNDILDFSGIVAGKFSITFEDIDVRNILEDSVESLKPAADAKGIQFNLEMGEQPAFVAGDPTRLRQLFSNLLSNAIKFTAERGTVQIRLKSNGEYFAIQIKDSGIGIEPDFLPRAFEPFSQANTGISRAYQGLGLGLAIALRLAHLHGGDIDANSPGRGQGTTFTVTLPARKLETLAI